MTYVQSGLERHKGIELGVTGMVGDNLTLFGGATFFGAKVVNSASTPMLDGRTPPNVSEQMFKLHAEYAIPRVRGLAATGSVFFTGKFFADTLNTDKLPGATTEDLGVRYKWNLERPLIFRFDVRNLSNKSYWMQSGYIGQPREILFPTEVAIF